MSKSLRRFSKNLKSIVQNLNVAIAKLCSTFGYSKNCIVFLTVSHSPLILTVTPIILAFFTYHYLPSPITYTLLTSTVKIREKYRTHTPSPYPPNLLKRTYSSNNPPRCVCVCVCVWHGR